MPNGGVHHCGGCCHLNRGANQCTLRNIFISSTHWTTCRDLQSKSEKPHGPVYSIVCEVKDGAGSYGDIPWFQDNRVDTSQGPDGGDTVVIAIGRNGERLEFPNVETYLAFWRENTPIDEQ
jgi:hypothetical protein